MTSIVTESDAGGVALRDVDDRDRRRTWSFGWLLLVAAFVFLPYVYASAFRHFGIFDDEGTLMLSLRDIQEGRILYDNEFVLYGPLYYLSIGSLFVHLQLPLTHNCIRAVASLFWIVDSALLAGLTYRFTRSLLAGGFAFAFVLFLLSWFISSPTHPEELCILLLALLSHLFIDIEQRPARKLPIAVGAILAAMALTKVNIGAFVILAVALAAIRVTHASKWRRPVFIVLVVATILMPLGLVSPLLHMRWVVDYCAFATAVIASTIFVWSRVTAPQILKWRDWRTCIIAAIVTAMVILGLTLLGGSTPQAILNAVVLQNQHLIRNWYIPVATSKVDVISAVIGTATAIGYAILSGRPGPLRLYAERAALWLKLILGLGSLGSFVLLGLFAHPQSHVWVFKTLMPFCWLIVVPREGSPVGPFARGAIGLVASLMILYLFPVCGTQLIDSVILLVAMLPTFLLDAIEGLRSTLPIPKTRRILIGRTAVWLPPILLGAIAIEQTKMAVGDYASDVPLGLPGAERIHVTPAVFETYHWLVREVEPCGSIYALQVPLSLHFWTGKPSVTGFNTNHPNGLLTWPQQERLVADLTAHTDLCVIVVPELVKDWDRGQIATNPPVMRYIHENFHVTEQNGPYQLWRRNSISD